MNSKEIYPYIVVYNNIFENPEEIYNIVKNIEKLDQQGLFEKWNPWYEHGEKIEKFGIKFNQNVNYFDIAKDAIVNNDIQEKQRFFITELIKGFHLVNNDYVKRYNFDLDINEKSNPINTEEDNFIDGQMSTKEEVSTWRWTGPSLCKYYIDAANGEELELGWHSDYIREPIISPGYKFAITTTTYLNDDYEGGELIFLINKEFITYKPKMGDFVVFPAGHPEILTQNGKIYLHGVKNSYKTEKYFTRLYWTKFHKGEDKWFENEKKYGKAEWLKMQDDIMVEYRKEMQQRDRESLAKINESKQ